MNRQEALEKSFVEFSEWPYGDGDYMVYSGQAGGIFGSGAITSTISINECWIVVATKQDWLDVKASKEKGMIEFKNGKEYIFDEDYRIEITRSPDVRKQGTLELTIDGVKSYIIEGIFTITAGARFKLDSKGWFGMCEIKKCKT